MQDGLSRLVLGTHVCIHVSFVAVVLLYLLSLVIFTVVNISLVFLNARSLTLAVRNIVVFGLFPILVFTKQGRQKLHNAIKGINF